MSSRGGYRRSLQKQDRHRGRDRPGDRAARADPLAPELPASLLTAATAAGILGASYVTRPAWAFPLESLLLLLAGSILFLGFSGRDAGTRIGLSLPSLQHGPEQRSTFSPSTAIG
ncbi:MAG: hypothetical protein U0411_14400 [Thermodesulfovibrionales bacterium]